MFTRRHVCQISFLIKAVHGVADQHLGLVDWEHVEIHENLPRRVILRTRGADGSCCCTHDRGRFAIPGAVAVGTPSPIHCIFQYPRHRPIVFRRNNRIAFASRIRLFNSTTLVGGFCSSSWLNGGMPSSSNVSTVTPFGKFSCSPERRTIVRSAPQAARDTENTNWCRHLRSRRLISCTAWSVASPLC